MNLTKLQKTIEGIGTGLQPEEDWVPTLIMENKKEISIIGFAPWFTQGQEGKDGCADQIVKFMKTFKPDAVCFISTAWSVRHMDEVDRDMYHVGLRKLSEHPKRVEIVSAYCAGERGENDGETMMFGYIERHQDKHPTIKKWKIWPMDSTLQSGGRFPDAIRKGFELVKGKT